MGHEKLDDIYKELVKNEINLVPKPISARFFTLFCAVSTTLMTVIIHRSQAIEGSITHTPQYL